VFESRVFESRVFESRVFESRVFESRVFDSRVFESRVFDSRVFESRVLSGIFGLKRDVVTGEWRKLHNKELHDLNSPTVVRVIKSRIMRWAVHVWEIGEV
jgi:hypothetical protein